jgi:hypothetical protein
MFDPRNRSNPNYILKLDAEIQRIKEETGIIKRTASIEQDRIVARTAAVRRLVEYGYNRSEISQRLNLNPYIVDTEVSRIEREEEGMDRNFAGWKRGSGGYFSIHNGLPTRR